MPDSFKAKIKIIGVNPYVSVPKDILQRIFKAAGKEKGHIPICGTVNGIPFKQTLVKYSGAWRLYINTKMLKNSPKRIGERIAVTVKHDPESRVIKPPADFRKALKANPEAKRVFEKLSPSRKHEIVRYLANLKNQETLNRSINRAISFLLGEGRFVGRDRP